MKKTCTDPTLLYLKITLTPLKKLIVYQKAFGCAMEIFHVSMKFPKNERFELTSQIRRSSRSVCANLGEAYRKRRYQKHFISKVTDADMENTETQVWLEFALACEYITKEKFEDLFNRSVEVGKILNFLINNPAKFK